MVLAQEHSGFDPPSVRGDGVPARNQIAAQSATGDQGGILADFPSLWSSRRQDKKIRTHKKFASPYLRMAARAGRRSEESEASWPAEAGLPLGARLSEGLIGGAKVKQAGDRSKCDSHLPSDTLAP
jgi:hypothetical protein